MLTHSSKIQYNTKSWPLVSVIMMTDAVTDGMLSLPSSPAVVGLVPGMPVVVFLGSLQHTPCTCSSMQAAPFRSVFSGRRRMPPTRFSRSRSSDRWYNHLRRLCYRTSTAHRTHRFSIFHRQQTLPHAVRRNFCHPHSSLKPLANCHGSSTPPAYRFSPQRSSARSAQP